MTYAAAVMWVWVVALLGTLVAFATAWRGLHRAEGALRELRPGTGVRTELDAARSDLDGATEATAAGRGALAARSVVAPS